MADETRPTSAHPAEPPGGGRQDHETMQDASMRGITGPASSDRQAAIGSLTLPGGEAHPELATHETQAGAAPELIPGERDSSTLTHREAGAVGGQFSGADIPRESAGGWLDDQTAHEHAREGGGAVRRKPGQGRRPPGDAGSSS